MLRGITKAGCVYYELKIYFHSTIMGKNMNSTILYSTYGSHYFVKSFIDYSSYLRLMSLPVY